MLFCLQISSRRTQVSHNLPHAGGIVSPRFVLFGPPHLAAIALTLAVPLALALLARHEHLGRHADRLTRIGLAAFLVLGLICWYGQTLWRHQMNLGNGLPMNLCDWAEIALIVAL